MRLFLLLGVLMGAYTFMLLKTTDIVIAQTQQLNSTYQYVANHSDQIATGQ
jgi:hypothetical protein